MVIYDFEVFKYNWLLCWIDTDTRKKYKIWDSKEKLEGFYKHYKNTILVGYNSRGYDQYILKGILCDFDPYEISKFIIVEERKGHEFSSMFNKFPILNYDCSVFKRSLKELEAFMGHSIKESPVSFNIDRVLTPSEKKEVEGYCFNDVDETFEVFVETKDTFETILELISEFKLPLRMVSKTETQLSAEILGAERITRNDEFDIKMPNALRLGKYQWILDEHFYPWSKNSKNYKEIRLRTEIMGVPHDFGVGGLHGAVSNYIGNGTFLMADVDSYYPASMIIYNYLSRNVSNPKKYREIRDTRLELKKLKNKKQACYKLVLNKAFGGSKDEYNKLYDPLQANNVCIANQLFLVDLLDKLEGHCELIQSNTDGVLLKLFKAEDEEKIRGIIKDWELRTGFTMGIDKYSKVVQRDVNNYILVPEGDLYVSGKEQFKRIGVVKKLSRLDNNLPIVNKALVDYFLHGTPPDKTIMSAKYLIDFQMVTKVGRVYDYATHGNKILNEKVNRVFASLEPEDTLYKKHRDKTTLDKVASVPVNCFIENGNIEGLGVPEKLDRNWYIKEAWDRINSFM